MSKYYTLKLNSFEYAGMNGSKPTEFVITEESAIAIREALKNHESYADIEVMFNKSFLWVRRDSNYLARETLGNSGKMMINLSSVVYTQPMSDSLCKVVDKIMELAPGYNVYETEFEAWCKHNYVNF